MSLSQRWIDKLAGLPESGMGYQIVNVHLKDGSIVKGIIVFNSSQIIDNVNFSEADIVDITMS